MVKIDDLEIIKKQAKLIKEFQTPIVEVMKNIGLQESFRPLNEGLWKSYGSLLKNENFKLGIQDKTLLGITQMCKKTVFDNNSLGIKEMSSNFSQGIISSILRETSMQNSIEEMIRQIDRPLSFNIHKDIWSNNILRSASKATTQSYIDIIKQCNNSIAAIYKDNYFNKIDNIDYDNIINLVKENYLNEDLTINEENYNKASEVEKSNVKKIVSGLFLLLEKLVLVLSLLDSPTLQLLIQQVPIIYQVYNAMVPDTVDTNGHIKSKTVNVFSYSSLSSHQVAKLEYGIPVEVISFHSGWLKIKYIGIEEEIKEGWIQEDNAIWSFNNE